MAQKLREALSYDFSFPVKARRIFPLQNPEIRLISLFLVATKLCFPFDSDMNTVRTDKAPISSSIDWKKWRPNDSIDTTESTESTTRIDMKNITPNEIVALGPRELDAYLDQISHLVEKKSTDTRNNHRNYLLT